MIGSALFAFPVGVMSGIYMNEYAPKGKLVRFIRVMPNNLSGIPSIVFGLFGMALFVKYLNFGDSIIAGSLTLGLLCVPLVIRTTEESLKAIPDSLRDSCVRKSFRRNSPHIIYLCCLFFTTVARKYF